jgi:hypothetical protein
MSESDKTRQVHIHEEGRIARLTTLTSLLHKPLTVTEIQQIRLLYENYLRDFDADGFVRGHAFWIKDCYLSIGVRKEHAQEMKEKLERILSGSEG